MSENKDYFTILTNLGRYKIARAAANKGEVKLSHFAVGDGNGVSVDPMPTQTKLVHEVWRGQIDSVTIDPKNPAAVIVNAIIPYNVGGFWMRELGLFDVDGDMLAVVKPAPYYKATDKEGQLDDVFYEFQLIIGEQAQVVVLVDPSILWATREFVETRLIPAKQLTCTPWFPVRAIDIVTPPTINVIGHTYLIPNNANGDWKNKSGQLAEWNGKSWNFIKTIDGHGIGLPDGSIYIKVNGQYVPLTDILDHRYSQLIAPPTDTFYVIGPNGNDNNTGFSTSPAEGFRTIQGAINKISSRYITTGTITINVSSGVYEGFSVSNSMVANWIIKSLEGNKKTVFINATDPNKPVKNACSTFFGTQVDIADMTLAGLYDTVATTQGTINIYNCDIMMGNASNSQAVACYGGAINLYGEMTVSGSGSVIFHATSCGNLGLGYYDANGKNPLTITYKDAKASWATFVCEKCSNVSVASAVVTFIGVPDSMSYTAIDNGIINTWGAGANIFPGTRGPWVGSGGIAS